jgi:hypothetical protein
MFAGDAYAECRLCTVHLFVTDNDLEIHECLRPMG